MSVGVIPFSVNLTQVRKAVGSRSKSLLQQLREEFEEELATDRELVDEANGDDDYDPELAIEDALRHLIMDRERWDYEGEKYGHAIQILCTFFGEVLHNEHWGRLTFTGIESIEDALLEAGVPAETFSIFDHLLHRGSPIEIPEIEGIPYIGYLTLAEIPDVLAAFTDKRLSAIKRLRNQQISLPIEQLQEWLETCQRDKSDLVCFYC